MWWAAGSWNVEDLQGDKEPAGRSKKEQPTKQEEGWAVQCAGHLGGQDHLLCGVGSKRFARPRCMQGGRARESPLGYTWPRGNMMPHLHVRRPCHCLISLVAFEFTTTLHVSKHMLT